MLKIVNTANGKVIARIETNMSMTLDEMLEFMGMNPREVDDDGACRDLRNEDGERLTLDEIRSERDVHSVTLNGEEYLLLYVL